MKREPLVEPPPPSARMIDFLLRQQQAEPPQQNQPQQQLHSSTNPLMKSCDDKSNGASIIHGQMSGDTPDTDGQRALAASDQHRQELLRLQQAIHQRQREIAEQSADRPSSRVFKLRAHLTRLEGANKKLAHQLVGSVKEQNRLARRASKAREEASAIDRETRDIHAAMEQLKQKHKEVSDTGDTRGRTGPTEGSLIGSNADPRAPLLLPSFLFSASPLWSAEPSQHRARRRFAHCSADAEAAARASGQSRHHRLRANANAPAVGRGGAHRHASSSCLLSPTCVPASCD